MINWKQRIARREAFLKPIEADETLQQQWRVTCARDVVQFVDHFAFTYDPREEHFRLPFTLFPQQKKFLRWIEQRAKNQEDGVAEKCRDVGFTWLCAAYAVHGLLFRPGFKCGFGSRKLDLVDKLGDPDCIFEKIRYLINQAPNWLHPEKLALNYCKIVNEAGGSSITGEGGDQIGRGGRSTIYFIDEAAYLERSFLVDAALSMTSRCKIWVSTPNGPGNSFYKKRHSGKYPVFTFRWSDDPRKNHKQKGEDGAIVYPWYEKQKALLDPITLAQEVDIDYTASIDGICIPAAWVRAAVDLHTLRADVITPAEKLKAAVDIAGLGSNLTVYGERRGVAVGEIQAWNGVRTTETAHRVVLLCREHGVTHLNFDNGGGYGDAMAAATSPDELCKHGEPLPFTAQGINSAAMACPYTKWPDGRTSRAKFKNLRAEMWWRLRYRFERTWEWREAGIDHPPDELISIPPHHELIAQLSLPRYEFDESGHIRIESKDSLSRRGIASPDFADMLVLLMYEPYTVEFGGS